MDHLPVIINEMAPPFRFITLTGRDRPEQPIVVGGEQRATQTYYPGSSRASVQVHGTREDPIVLRGWFSDPLTIIDGGAKTRMAILRGLMQGQNPCGLTWGFMIVRTGRVKRCEFSIHRANRVRYEITFEVDQPSDAVAMAPRPLLPVSGAAILAGLNAIKLTLSVQAELKRGVNALGALK